MVSFAFPFYIVCGSHLLHALLRRSSRDPIEGVVPPLAMIQAKVAQRQPKTHITKGGSAVRRFADFAYRTRRS